MKRIVLFAAALAAVAGCNKSNLAAAENGGDPMPSSADIVALKGVWKVDTSALQNNSASQQDPKAALGQLMADLMNEKIRFRSDATFKYSKMGLPIDGHYTINGNHITLVPEKIKGQTFDQFKEAQKKSGDSSTDADELAKKIEGDLAPDRSSLTIHSTNQFTNDDQPLVFKKQQQEFVQSTLSNQDEHAVAGLWEGTMNSSNFSGGTESSQALAKAMFGNPELELKQNNTYTMGSLGEEPGTWSAQNGQITLIPTHGGVPVMLTISADHKTLTLSQGYENITFVREE